MTDFPVQLFVFGAISAIIGIIILMVFTLTEDRLTRNGSKLGRKYLLRRFQYEIAYAASGFVSIALIGFLWALSKHG